MEGFHLLKTQQPQLKIVLATFCICLFTSQKIKNSKIKNFQLCKRALINTYWKLVTWQPSYWSAKVEFLYEASTSAQKAADAALNSEDDESDRASV